MTKRTVVSVDARILDKIDELTITNPLIFYQQTIFFVLLMVFIGNSKEHVKKSKMSYHPDKKWIM